MGRVLRLPTEDEVPPGPKRSFLEEIYFHYQEAGRPTPLEIADELAQRDNMTGTASRETIRRMLRGETVPVRWSTVAAVFVLFCERSGINPRGARSRASAWGQGGPVLSHGEVLQKLWNAALANDENVRSFGPPGQTLSDEPPF